MNFMMSKAYILIMIVFRTAGSGLRDGQLPLDRRVLSITSMDLLLTKQRQLC